METLKRCSRCGEEKKVAEFSLNSSSKDGLRSRCKECDRACRKPNKERIAAIDRAYRERNKERIAERQRIYAASHKEQRAERQRAWRKSHPGSEYIKNWWKNNKERKAEYGRRFRATHGKQIAQYKRIYNMTHEEQLVEYQRAYNTTHKAERVLLNRAWRKNNKEQARTKDLRYRARKLNAEGIHTADDIKAQYERQSGKCYYAACGHSELGDTYHVDHIVPLSRGGSNWPENLVLTCPHCNTSKGAKLPSEWPQGGRLL